MNKNISIFYRVASCLVAGIFTLTSIVPPASAQNLNFSLPSAGPALSPSGSAIMMNGLRVYPQEPMRFDFIMVGDEKSEYQRLIKYFLASLTIPEEDLWVNLNPEEPDRIVPQSFGQTEMGRDMLAQDYLLKQITASLLHPDNEYGKQFWERIYEQVGTTEIPIETLSKVWIVPEKAEVYEGPDVAYVVDARFKVMTEEEYRKNKSTSHINILHETIIPELTRAVNEDSQFTNLRQIFNSLILATWYKRKLKHSLVNQVFADQHKTAGLETPDGEDVNQIYANYINTFKEGVFEFIKDEYNPVSQDVTPRKYISGGVVGTIDITPAKHNFYPDTSSASAMVSVELEAKIDAAMANEPEEDDSEEPDISESGTSIWDLAFRKSEGRGEDEQSQGDKPEQPAEEELEPESEPEPEPLPPPKPQPKPRPKGVDWRTDSRLGPERQPPRKYKKPTDEKSWAMTVSDTSPVRKSQSAAMSADNESVDDKTEEIIQRHQMLLELIYKAADSTLRENTLPLKMVEHFRELSDPFYRHLRRITGEGNPQDFQDALGVIRRDFGGQTESRGVKAAQAGGNINREILLLAASRQVYKYEEIPDFPLVLGDKVSRRGVLKAGAAFAARLLGRKLDISEENQEKVRQEIEDEEFVLRTLRELEIKNPYPPIREVSYAGSPTTHTIYKNRLYGLKIDRISQHEQSLIFEQNRDALMAILRQIKSTAEDDLEALKAEARKRPGEGTYIVSGVLRHERISEHTRTEWFVKIQFLKILDEFVSGEAYEEFYAPISEHRVEWAIPREQPTREYDLSASAIRLLKQRLSTWGRNKRAAFKELWEYVVRFKGKSLIRDTSEQRISGESTDTVQSNSFHQQVIDRRKEIETKKELLRFMLAEDPLLPGTLSLQQEIERLEEMLIPMEIMQEFMGQSIESLGQPLGEKSSKRGPKFKSVVVPIAEGVIGSAVGSKALKEIFRPGKKQRGKWGFFANRTFKSDKKQRDKQRVSAAMTASSASPARAETSAAMVRRNWIGLAAMSLAFYSSGQAQENKEDEKNIKDKDPIAYTVKFSDEDRKEINGYLEKVESKQEWADPKRSGIRLALMKGFNQGFIDFYDIWRYEVLKKQEGQKKALSIDEKLAIAKDLLQRKELPVRRNQAYRYFIHGAWVGFTEALFYDGREYAHYEAKLVELAKRLEPEMLRQVQNMLAFVKKRQITDAERIKFIDGWAQFSHGFLVERGFYISIANPHRSNKGLWRFSDNIYEVESMQSFKVGKLAGQTVFGKKVGGIARSTRMAFSAVGAPVIFVETTLVEKEAKRLFSLSKIPPARLNVYDKQILALIKDMTEKDLEGYVTRWILMQEFPHQLQDARKDFRMLNPDDLGIPKEYWNNNPVALEFADSETLAFLVGLLKTDSRLVLGHQAFRKHLYEPVTGRNPYNVGLVAIINWMQDRNDPKTWVRPHPTNPNLSQAKLDDELQKILKDPEKVREKARQLIKEKWKNGEELLKIIDDFNAAMTTSSASPAQESESAAMNTNAMPLNVMIANFDKNYGVHRVRLRFKDVGPRQNVTMDATVIGEPQSATELLVELDRGVDQFGYGQQTVTEDDIETVEILELRPFNDELVSNPNRKMTTHHAIEIEESGGQEVSFAIDYPQNEGDRPVAFLFHGYKSSKDSRLLREAANELITLGYIVVRVDFRNNHTPLSLRNQSTSDIKKFILTEAQIDAEHVIRFVRDEIPNTDLQQTFMFASSFAAPVARRLRQQFREEIKLDYLFEVAGAIHPDGSIYRLLREMGVTRESFDDVIPELKEAGEFTEGPLAGYTYATPGEYGEIATGDIELLAAEGIPYTLAFGADDHTLLHSDIDGYATDFTAVDVIDLAEGEIEIDTIEHSKPIGPFLEKLDSLPKANAIVLKGVGHDIDEVGRARMLAEMVKSLREIKTFDAAMSAPSPGGIMVMGFLEAKKPQGLDTTRRFNRHNDEQKVSRILYKAFVETGFYTPTSDDPREVLDVVRELYTVLPETARELLRVNLHSFDLDGVWPSNIFLAEHLTALQKGKVVERDRPNTIRSRMELPIDKLGVFNMDAIPWDERVHWAYDHQDLDIGEIERIHRVLSDESYPTVSDIRDVEEFLKKAFPRQKGSFKKIWQFYFLLRRNQNIRSHARDALLYILAYFKEYEEWPHYSDVNKYLKTQGLSQVNILRRSASKVKLSLPWESEIRGKKEQASPKTKPIDRQFYEKLKRYFEAVLPEFGLNRIDRDAWEGKKAKVRKARRQIRKANPRIMEYLVLIKEGQSHTQAKKVLKGTYFAKVAKGSIETIWEDLAKKAELSLSWRNLIRKVNLAYNKRHADQMKRTVSPEGWANKIVGNEKLQNKRKLVMWKSKGGAAKTFNPRSYNASDVVEFYGKQGLLNGMEVSDVAKFLGYGYTHISDVFKRYPKLYKFLGGKSAKTAVKAAAAMTVAEESRADAAMENPGGIDFNPNTWELDVRGVDGVDCLAEPDHASCIQLQFSPEQIEDMRANIIGFTPVIINIQPIPNLPLILGLDQPQEDEKEQPAHSVDLVAMKE